MFGQKKEIDDLKRMIKMDKEYYEKLSSEFKVEVARRKALETEVADLKSRCEGYSPSNNAMRNTCGFAFDFSLVYGIERSKIGTVDECTVIAYKCESKDSGTKLREWYFQCSRETHNKLVEEYENYLKNRK